MPDLQTAIQALLDEACQQGHERGIQVAVYHQGRLVVDAWAGHRDPAQTLPVDGETLFPVFSTSKGITATVIHRLAARGLLDYDAPIADYWPEFGCNGKEGITLRHALNHTAGLANMPPDTVPRDLCDWDGMCRRLAALAPSSPPGSQAAYHAVTYGWLVGEVACRVARRPFSELLEQEVCRPLGLTGMYIGLPEARLGDVAVLEDVHDRSEMVAASATAAIPGYICPLHVWMNHPDGQRSCAPASSGIMDARSIARHYAALLPGGVDGVALLSQGRVVNATARGHLNDGTELGRGLGYSLGGGEGSILGPLSTSFGTGGFGGSVGFADPVNGLAVGLTKNLFAPGAVEKQVVNEIRTQLGLANA